MGTSEMMKKENRSHFRSDVSLGWPLHSPFTLCDGYVRLVCIVWYVKDHGNNESIYGSDKRTSGKNEEKEEGENNEPIAS